MGQEPNATDDGQIVEEIKEEAPVEEKAEEEPAAPVVEEIVEETPAPVVEEIVEDTPAPEEETAPTDDATSGATKESERVSSAGDDGAKKKKKGGKKKKRKTKVKFNLHLWDKATKMWDRAGVVERHDDGTCTVRVQKSKEDGRVQGRWLRQSSEFGNEMRATIFHK